MLEPSSTCLPQRSQRVASDPDEARDVLTEAFGARLRVGGAVESDWAVSIRSVLAGGYSLSEVRAPADLGYRVEGLDGQILISAVTAGWASYERGKSTTRYRPGDVYVGNCPRVAWDCRSADFVVQIVGLPVGLLDEAAGAPRDQPGPSTRPLTFDPLPGSTGQWRQAVRFVGDMLANPAAPASPLMIGAAGRLLAATMLAIFPAPGQAGSAARDRHDAHPDTLRRAVAYIEANPDVDVTVADIAQAAHVTPRTVQIAFRRHLDTTPMAYLRRVRLDRAHADLQAAVPGDGATVASVAARWGYAQPGRFAGDYRALYGRHPSRTLRD
ncbi:helix-turn-helix transcriptional regulator [Cryptosporangium sp. NPDC048952]|uniref:helix-turn-helix transcriptional regulator n=1 Tax=Cryptosporangium sp. NPDC048952 TaxID=3363961 RepID=UPI003723B278